jgi:hypothetical protein
LVCSRTDVLRYGLRALLRDSARIEQIRADNLARAFLASLRSNYGENAVLELVDGDPPDGRWQLAGEPVDPNLIGTEVARHGDRWVLNLIDKASDVAIRNVLSWHDGDGGRHAVISLRDLWVYSFSGAIGQPEARQLVDGRTVVQISEDDGTVRHLVIDNEGNSARLTADDVPAADRLAPSIGVGVRRESEFGPHLGHGVGGQWQLTGNVDEDRAAVVDALEQLLVKAREGQIDDLLSTPTVA